jgi:hypothetical protein
MHGNCLDFQLLTGSQDAQRYLTTVCDEYFFQYGHALFLCLSLV